MKKIVTLLFVALALLGGTIPAFAKAPPSDLMALSGDSAAMSVTPRLSHCSNANFEFTVANGKALFSTDYTGTSTFGRAVLTVQVDKKFLGLFWRGVDSWTTTCFDKDAYLQGSIPVDGSGTYRAYFTLQVIGTDGISDVIEESIQYVYNP